MAGENVPRVVPVVVTAWFGVCARRENAFLKTLDVVYS